MNNYRTINQIVENKVINSNTGEVEITETRTNLTVSKEPNYIKIYLDDIVYFSQLPSSSSGILFSIAKRMGYDNKIVLVKNIKEDIANENNLDLGTINNAISNFKKKNILIADGRSTYIINPNLIGKGSWTDISKLRMEIQYSPEGRSIKAIEIERAED